MKYQSINPYTGEVIKDFSLDPLPDLSIPLAAFEQWRKLSIEERGAQMLCLSLVIEGHKDEYAHLITQEMGKPYRESLYEINKVLTAFEYYINNAPHMLAHEVVETAASKSYISFDPLGVIFSVMPWNFPFWQVFRFAVPALMAGNVTILKHAPSVSLCAEAIEEAFIEAGFIEGVFTKCNLHHDDVAALIASPHVAGVSFTGSDSTGSVIAGLAGRHIKKCVVELGGNDAFIVMDDADIDMAVAGAIKSRTINSGQSCNAAKRFIVMEKAYDTFLTKLTHAVSSLYVGDPMKEGTQIGPLARRDLAEKVSKQIAGTIAQGAKAYTHPYQPGADTNFVPPVVLADVRPGMTAADEEIFGPVWSVMKAGSIEDAITMANQSAYGLGASIWTSHPENAERFATDLQAGSVFINDIVKSDAQLPFGGVKRSGFGRELSEFGLREFVNVKTVFIK